MTVKQHVQETGGREEDEGGIFGRFGCVVLEEGSKGDGQRSLLRSAQGMDAIILSVLDSIVVSAGALIPYVTGHGEWNHLGGRRGNNSNSVSLCLQPRALPRVLDTEAQILFVDTYPRNSHIPVLLMIKL